MKIKKCPTCGQQIVKKQDNNVENPPSFVSGDARDVVKFYRHNRTGFLRKVAQTVASTSSLFEKNVSTKPLKSKRRRSYCQVKLPPLEQSVIRLKHLRSLNFINNQIPYVVTSSTCSDKHALRTHFTSDSLTFEFFNTISPISVGNCSAKFDVFLCGVNSDQRSLHFWEHLLTFVSLVNDKKRQNKVLEIWVPELGDCCDQLLLVVDGCVINENNRPKALTCFPIGVKRRKRRMLDPKSQRSNNTLHQFTQLDIQPNGNDCLFKVDQTKINFIAAKRQRLEEDDFNLVNNSGTINVTNYENNENMDLSINSDSGKHQQRRIRMLRSSYSGAKFVNSPKEHQDETKTSSYLPTLINSKIRLRGTRLIGKWINKQTLNKNEAGNLNQFSRVFTPIFSSKGIYLNTSIINKNEMSGLADLKNLNYQMIEDINIESSKRASRDSCSILQVFFKIYYEIL